MARNSRGEGWDTHHAGKGHQPDDRMTSPPVLTRFKLSAGSGFLRWHAIMVGGSLEVLIMPTLMSLAEKSGVPQKRVRQECKRLEIPVTRQEGDRGSVHFLIDDRDVPALLSALEQLGPLTRRPRAIGGATGKRSRTVVRQFASSCRACGRPVNPLSGRCGCS
jgi:hypothetical protein